MKLGHKHKDWLFGFFIVIVVFSGLRLIYGPIVTNPNNYLPTYKGDGIRNYFIFANTIKNDNSFWHVSGQNYPFGEHPLYAECQPVVTMPFRLIAKVFPGLKDHGVGLQNLLTFWSLILCAVVLFLIFRKLGLPHFFAAFGGMGLMALGPQVYRIPYMPSLAYAFFIPLAFLIYLSYHASRWHIRWSIVIGFYTLFWFLIHPYAGLMLSFTFLSLGLFHFLFRKGAKLSRKVIVLDACIQSIFPVLIFAALLFFTDNHPERISSPVGVFDFTATFGTLFTQHGDYIFSFLTNRIFHPDKTVVMSHWEGWGYIGVTGIGVMVLLICRVIYRLAKRKNIRLSIHRPLNAMFFAGVILLLYSMGFPFSLHESWHGMIDYFPGLRQFRSPGRSVWVFYYAVGIYVVYFCYLISRTLSQKGFKLTGWLFIAGACCLYFVEGVDVHRHVALGIKGNGNIFDQSVLCQTPHFQRLCKPLGKLEIENYQAIVPLPYFHWGSDIIQPPTDYTYTHFASSYALAYHSGVPITAVYFPRMSTVEALHSIQFFAYPFMDKEIKDYFKDERPVLLFFSKGEKLSPRERAILDLGITVFENDTYLFKELTWEDMWKNRSHEIITPFEEKKDSFVAVSGGWYLQDSTSIVLHLDFDDNATDLAFSGKGALVFKHNEAGSVTDFSMIDEPKPPLTVSFWMNAGENRLQADVVLAVPSENGKLEITKDLNFAKRTVNIVDGWLMVEFDLEPDEMKGGVELFVKGHDANQFSYIDNLLIRKKGTTVYKVQVTGSQKHLWWNNFPIQSE